MAVKVVNFKNWCEENITPMAWPRVVLKVIPDLRSEGFSIKQLEEPAADFTVDDAVFGKLNDALKGLYDTEVTQEVLA